MIKSIRLQNFFGFQDCTVNLEPGANVLIGINGSGKSNFFKAIQLLKEGVIGHGYRKQINDYGGFDEIVNHSTTNNNDITLTYEFHSDALAKFGFQFRDTLTYDLKINRVAGSSNYSLSEKLFSTKPGRSAFYFLDFNNGSGFASERDSTGPKLKYSEFDPQLTVTAELGDPDRFYPISSFRKAIQKLVTYKYFETGSSSIMRKAVPSTPSFILEEDGWNIAQMIDTFELNDNPVYLKILESLQQVNPYFNSIRAQNVAGNLQLVITEKGLYRATNASHISDGTLRFLCLMAIFYNPKRGNVVCTDEPELGLHPDMLNTLHQAIRHASETSQVIISTHSAELLNHFDVENIRVFEKDENNATVINKYEAKEFEGFMNKYMAGQLWRQGHLGGNRW